MNISKESGKVSMTKISKQSKYSTNLEDKAPRHIRHKFATTQNTTPAKCISTTWK